MMSTYRGRVREGVGRAAVLRFPTVNIALPKGAGASGIYAARVRVGGRELPAAAYADPARGILEAHLLDFEGDLYGKEVSIELLEKIRDARRFERDDELRAAIATDVESVRRYFTL